MKQILDGLLVSCGYLGCFYWIWTEAGPFEWWANLLMRDHHSYSVFWAQFGTIMTILLPLGLLSKYIFRVDEQEWDRRTRNYIIVLGIALIIGSVGCVLLQKPLRVTGGTKAIFQQASMLPREFILDPHHLPRLERNFAVGISEIRTDRPKGEPPAEPMLYIPFDPRCWPDASTPVIYKLTRSRYAELGNSSSLVFSMRKRPVPLLVRQKWKATTLRYAVVVSPHSAISEDWSTFWIFGGAMVLTSIWRTRRYSGVR